MLRTFGALRSSESFVLPVSKNKITVRIENPLAGGSPYTSPKGASGFVARRVAEFTGPRSIRFVDRYVNIIKAAAAEHRLFRRDESDDHMIAERMGGRLPWNGCDTREKAFHLPFTATVFHRARIRIPVRNGMMP